MNVTRIKIDSFEAFIYVFRYLFPAFEPMIALAVFIKFIYLHFWLTRDAKIYNFKKLKIVYRRYNLKLISKKA